MDDYPFHGSEAPHTASYLWPCAVAALRNLQGEPVRRVVDLGAGNGVFSAHLSTLGYRVTAIEPSESGIGQLRAAHPDMESIHASAYDDLSQFHGMFDAAVALEVVEHCYYPRKLAAALAMLVKPGGLVVVSTPYHGYWKNLAIAILGRSDAHFTALWEHGHIKFWSIRTLSALLTQAGLTVEQVARVGRVPALAKSMVLIARKLPQVESRRC